MSQSLRAGYDTADPFIYASDLSWASAVRCCSGGEMTQHRLERMLRYNPLSIDLTAEWEMQEKLRCPTFVLDEQNRAVIDCLPYLTFPTLHAAQKFARRVTWRASK
jgi:hypothetical protein